MRQGREPHPRNSQVATILLKEPQSRLIASEAVGRLAVSYFTDYAA